MAKQIGSGFIGTVDGLSCYYNRLHGYLVRQTGGVTSKQYHKDQRYEAARDNSSEFSVVSRTGKLIREALGAFLHPVKDGTMVNRLNKELVALKQQDRTHFRGERRPEVMMTDEEANLHFRIFQFNQGVKLYDLTEDYPAPDKPLQLKAAAFPEGASHAGLTLVRTVIDFENGTYRTVSSRMTVVSKAYAETVNLPELPGLHVAGTEIVCLQVVFFKEQNGDLVQVKGRVHSMGVLSTKQVVAGAAVGRLGVDQLSVGQLLVKELSVDELLVKELSVDQLSVGELGVGELSVGELGVSRGKQVLRRRRRCDYKRVLRGEDMHVYVHLHPANRNERGYFIFRNGEKVFL